MHLKCDTCIERNSESSLIIDEWVGESIGFLIKLYLWTQRSNAGIQYKVIHNKLYSKANQNFFPNSNPYNPSDIIARHSDDDYSWATQVINHSWHVSMSLNTETFIKIRKTTGFRCYAGRYSYSLWHKSNGIAFLLPQRIII